MAWDKKVLAVTTFGGLHLRVLDPTHAPGHPTWSPDGRSLAYTSGPATPGVPGGDEAQLWLMRADGSSQRLQGDGISEFTGIEPSQRPSPWFGYYGATEWSRAFDWWQPARII